MLTLQRRKRTDLQVLADWAKSRLGSLGHERRVLRIAAHLFDLTAGLHDLTPWHRRLLKAAALVHDVGRSIDKEQHPRHGARLLLRERSLSLPRSIRRALAFLTLYHRDAVPEAGEERILTAADDRAALRKLLALLRAADSLDSRSLESPRLFFTLRRRRIQVRAYLADPTGKAKRAYSRRKKLRLLERELECRVRVELEPAHRLRLVA
jgi:exopolyphosphatase/guanosine-5'-triphosphate,3'-diphosphate pyrophosphatase